MLSPGGTVEPGGNRGVFYGGSTGGLSGYVLQVGNYSYPAGAGPWTLSAFNLQTLTSTNLQIPEGADFTFPNDTFPQLLGLSTFIGAGEFAGQGLAYDLSQNLIVPIAIANGNVAPL